MTAKLLRPMAQPLPRLTVGFAGTLYLDSAMPCSLSKVAPGQKVRTPAPHVARAQFSG